MTGMDTRGWWGRSLALEELPETSRAMANGELSFTKVRALTRVATAENEDVLLELARSGSAANLERVVRGWKQLDRKSEVSAEQVRYRTRRCSAFIDDDGMVVVRARLDPEAGAMLMRAIEAAGDALFKDDPEEDPARRRADAVGLIAERALAAGFTSHDDAPVSGGRADRTQVVLHIDESTLAEDQEPGLSELEDATRVSAETSRRVACDAGVVRMTRLERHAHRRRPPHPHGPPRPPSRPRGTGSRLPLPRLRAPVHRRPSCQTLGPWG